MNTTQNKIICVHLLNNFTGSPKVFGLAIKALISKGAEVDLYTSPGEGFLTGTGADLHPIPYKWSPSRLMRLFYYSWSQLKLFFRLLKYRNQEVTFYLNTLLPFGAALAAKLMGKPLVYHIHEPYINPPLLDRMLKKCVGFTAGKALFVSRFLQDYLSLKKPATQSVIYNSLSDEFVQKAGAHDYHYNGDSPLRVLMLCSLKKEKGIFDFIKIAHALADLKFTLVVSAPQAQLNEFLGETELPANLCLYPVQSDVHPFYKQADLLLNLSNPDGFIETFGMTILEGMSYGIPCIVPPVGGQIEFVTDAVQGYISDVRSLAKIIDQIDHLSKEPEILQVMSINARKKAAEFSMQQFGEQITAQLIPTQSTRPQRQAVLVTQ